MNKSQFFSLGKIDEEFEGFYLDDQAEVWFCIHDKFYEYTFDSDTEYFCFFGEKVRNKNRVPLTFESETQFLNRLGEEFLNHLSSTPEWKNFINKSHPPKRVSDSNCLNKIFYMVVSFNDQEYDELLEPENYSIDGLFSTIEEAIDFAKDISKAYDKECIVLGSLGSVKNNVCWCTHSLQTP